MLTAEQQRVQKLLDWLKEKIEAGRILWENDAPVVQGMIEEIEADHEES